MSNTNDIFQVDYQPEKKEIRINLPEEFESGAFDADTSEIQRLRAALEMAQSELRWGDPANAIERVERIIDKALSTATEPTNAAKVKRIECPCCGCEISINAPKGDENE